MDILDRIVILLNGRNQKELCDYLNLDKSAVTAWKNGSSKSYQKYLIEIANFFNVSIDYLVYGKEPPSFDKSLSSDERQFIDKFNRLKDIDKGKILERMDMIYESYPPAAIQEPQDSFNEHAEFTAASLDQKKHLA